MFAKCACIHCRESYEFDIAEFVPNGESMTERIGQKITCPHCGQDTIPSLPKIKPEDRPQRTIAQILTTNCPVCAHQISTKALMCPGCGHAAGVRFRFVWDVMCNVVLANLIFAIIGAIIYAMYSVALSAWK